MLHHGNANKKEQVYTPAQLLSTTPHNFLHWMNDRYFGNLYPPPDANPERALLLFMPLKKI